jgi:hypothetical protein
MKRLDFFIKATNANMPLKLWWLTICFTTLNSDANANEEINYAVRKVSGIYQYYLENEWIAFEDSPKTGPLYTVAEPIVVDKDQILNIKEKTNTTVTRLIANCILVSSIFDDRIPYINKKYKIGDVVKLIKENVVDDKDHIPGKTYSMSEYLKLCNRANYITTLSNIFFSSAGPELMEQPSWVKSYRAELMLKYKDELDKPETVAKIDAALLDRFKKEVLSKGSSSRFVVKEGKQIDIATKKLILSYGAEFGIGSNSGNKGITYIPNSLAEGIDPKYLPALYNAQRAGSYGRGKETAEGGYSTKEMMAATQNFTISDKDCGSKNGVDVIVTEQNKKDLVGQYFIGTQNVIKEEDLNKYLGKVIKTRSPLYCKTPNTEWCVYCLGNKLTINKNALPVAAIGVSSALLLLSMAKAHSKGMSLVKLDLEEVIL